MCFIAGTSHVWMLALLTGTDSHSPPALWVLPRISASCFIELGFNQPTVSLKRFHSLESKSKGIAFGEEDRCLWLLWQQVLQDGS